MIRAATTLTRGAAQVKIVQLPAAVAGRTVWRLENRSPFMGASSPGLAPSARAVPEGNRAGGGQAPKSWVQYVPARPPPAKPTPMWVKSALRMLAR